MAPWRIHRFCIQTTFPHVSQWIRGGLQWWWDWVSVLRRCHVTSVTWQECHLSGIAHPHSKPCQQCCHLLSRGALEVSNTTRYERFSVTYVLLPLFSQGLDQRSLHLLSTAEENIKSSSARWITIFLLRSVVWVIFRDGAEFRPRTRLRK